jgi:hypothetical protein
VTFSDETVMAYVDGELDDPMRAAVEAAMATDSELRRRIARHRELRVRLQREFDPVLREPIPEQLIAAVKGTPTNGHARKIISLKRFTAKDWNWPQWGALAASLILGVLIAPLLRHEPTTGTLGLRDGKVLASGRLAHELSDQLASTQAANGPLRIGVSFLSRNGNYCRTFVLRDKSVVAGIACREAEGWHLEALTTIGPARSGSGEYRPAASSLPPLIQQSVEDLIVGDPLDGRGEAAARENDWHP